MNRVIVILLFVILSRPSPGQFTYFNNYYLAPDWENDNSGTMTNLFVNDSTLIAYGVVYASGNFSYWAKSFNYSGAQQSDILFNLAPFIVPACQYNESANEYINNDLVWGGSEDDYDSLYLCPIVKRFNPDWTEEWSRRLDYLFANDDSVIGAEFHFAQPLANNDIFCAGPVWYNLDDDNWPDESGLLLARYSEDGDSLYEKIIRLWYPEYSDFYHGLFRVNQCFELENGDILIAGMWYEGAEIPWYMRVSSAGEFEGFFQFETLCSDYSVWGTKMQDNKIAFAYSHCVNVLLEENILPERDIRIGVFDPEAMDTMWSAILPHLFYKHIVHDFTSTPDGGYAILSYVYGSWINSLYSHERGAFITKLDSALQEEWSRFYPTPLPSENNSSVSAYDLEVTPDGGFAVVGNFMPENENYNVTWLIKTDCAGFLEPTEPTFFPSITQLNDSTFLCQVESVGLFHFEWNFGNGQQLTGDSLVYSYSESGNFTITITGSSCLGEEHAEFEVTATVGVRDAQFPVFMIWPNPTNNSLINVHCSSPANHVVIKDVTCRTLFLLKPLSNNFQIDVSNFVPGTYLIEVQFSNLLTTIQQIVIE